jgi:hypothetical protein
LRTALDHTGGHIRSSRQFPPSRQARGILIAANRPLSQWDDNDHRLRGITAQIARMPKPSCQVALRTPLYAVRNRLRTVVDFP